jgi:DNA topoisomerase-1
LTSYSYLTTPARQVRAQQARRILDRLVGYQVSPILWRKAKKGLSAGRVQSVALRLVVDREREIEAFRTEEYWTIEADLKRVKDTPDSSFTAVLSLYDGKKIPISDGTHANSIVDSVKNEKFIVNSVERKERKKNASPFITSHRAGGFPAPVLQKDDDAR